MVLQAYYLDMKIENANKLIKLGLIEKITTENSSERWIEYVKDLFKRDNLNSIYTLASCDYNLKSQFIIAFINLNSDNKFYLVVNERYGNDFFKDIKDGFELFANMKVEKRNRISHIDADGYEYDYEYENVILIQRHYVGKLYKLNFTSYDYDAE